MSKKIIIALVVVLLPVFILAADEVIDKDHWAYKDIKSLVDAKVITMPLDKDQLTREEMVGYINNGVDNMLAAKEKKFPESNASLKEYIDKLYNLVKAYQTDMMAVGQKLDSIEEELGDLKAKKQALEAKQDKLLNSMGMRINGETAAYMTDALIFGSKNGLDNQLLNAEKIPLGTTSTPSVAALRYRPINQYIDLMFSLHANKELYSEATFRMENMFGGFWGSEDIVGLKRFFIQGEYPVSFIVGDYQAKLTPFTIWAVDDERPFEAKIFSDKRAMNEKELYLIDNSWPVGGGKISTIVNFFSSLDVGVDAMFARLGQNFFGGYLNLPFGEDLGGVLPSGDIYAHDQYMGAARLSSDCTLKDLLNIGLNFVEIKDARDTGPDYNTQTLDNYVTSADGSINIFNIAKLKAEYAISNYCVANPLANANFNPAQVWMNTYLTDSALKAGIEADYFGTKLDISYREVGNSFTAYAAQSRIYDEINNPWQYYLTQNNTWNVSMPEAAYIIGGSTEDNKGKIYPLTRYNNLIYTNYNPIGSNLMAYPFFENNSTPYGDATPNRQGITIKLSGDYLDDFIQPYVKYQMLSEIVTDIIVNNQEQPRNFAVTEGGVKINLGDDLSLLTGYKNEETDNSSNVLLTSNIFDLGLNYVMMRKITLSIGLRNIAFSGHEYFDLGTGAYGGQIYYNCFTSQNVTVPMVLNDFNMDILSYGAGVEYKIAKPATLGLSYTLSKITDHTDSANSYGVQEVDAKVVVKF